MCNVLRQGSEVCNWYQLANSPSLQSRRILLCDPFELLTDRALGRVKKWFSTIKRLLWGYNSPVWRRRSKVFKKSAVDLNSAFYPYPAFYSQSAVFILHSVCILPLVRGLQSAVRSPQSAVRSLPLTLTIFSTVACNATPARDLWYVNYITPFPRNVSLGRLCFAWRKWRMCGVRTKHGPGVHGLPPWTGSMDHFHGPGPWTPCHGPGPYGQFFF